MSQLPTRAVTSCTGSISVPSPGLQIHGLQSASPSSERRKARAADWLICNLHKMCWSHYVEVLEICRSGSYYMLHYYIILHRIILHHITSHCIILHHITSYFIIVHHIASYCIILHRSASNCIILHPIALWCIILHHIASEYILHHITS